MILIIRSIVQLSYHSDTGYQRTKILILERKKKEKQQEDDKKDRVSNQWNVRLCV